MEGRAAHALDDCGTRINPMIIEGQIHGGLNEAFAVALGQQIAFDEAGNLLGNSLMDYFLPTFVETPRGVAILGTPGGSRIITMVLLGSMEYLHGGDAKAIVDRPRFHHQYLPDEVIYEPGAFAQATLDTLKKTGYVLRESDGYGNMQAVVWDREKGALTAASDPRGIGEALVRLTPRKQPAKAQGQPSAGAAIAAPSIN